MDKFHVFKFGGASVKDAAGVRRLAEVLRPFPSWDLVVVVSAMGKTTNALEQVVQAYRRGEQSLTKKLSADLHRFHFGVARQLFPQGHPQLEEALGALFLAFEQELAVPPEGNYNRLYDRLVSFGELWSTQIVSHFLQAQGFEHQWLDARQWIRTDQNYRFARVDWLQSQRLVGRAIARGGNYLTQGFIGADGHQHPTTLGREGSDYTASVLAYLLDADEVIIWKDVPGVLNGDPKVFVQTELLEQLSYREAIELAYYGASVIHPKTIQPLQQKNIPLRVRSFVDPASAGTRIGEGPDLHPAIPCYICKDQQVLLRLSTVDLTFVVEDHLSLIYRLFHQHGARVNLSQNSAVSSSFCLNNDPVVLPALQEELAKTFAVEALEGVSLYTVRHPNKEAQERVRAAGEVLLEQITRNTYQVVVA